MTRQSLAVLATAALVAACGTGSAHFLDITPRRYVGLEPRPGGEDVEAMVTALERSTASYDAPARFEAYYRSPRDRQMAIAWELSIRIHGAAVAAGADPRLAPALLAACLRVVRDPLYRDTGARRAAIGILGLLANTASLPPLADLYVEEFWFVRATLELLTQECGGPFDVTDERPGFRDDVEAEARRFRAWLDEAWPFLTWDPESRAFVDRRVARR